MNKQKLRCRDCGVSLQLDEEQKDGICVCCDNEPKKYKIELDLNREIEAVNEEEALIKFFDSLELSNDTIENYIIAKKIK